MPKINQAKIEIEHAAGEATKAIANAAGEAVKAIAHAAEEAARVVANTAATTAKVVDTKTSGDHDLLIKVEVKLDALKEDIQKLSDGTSTQISDHEIRLNALESSKTKQNTMMTIGIGILSVMVSILVYHVLGK